MAKKKNKQENGQSTADLSANDLLKAKLRHKYYALRDDALKQETREQLLNYVCETLGMNRPTLDNVLIDL
jgi:hypothetical protein